MVVVTTNITLDCYWNSVWSAKLFLSEDFVTIDGPFHNFTLVNYALPFKIYYPRIGEKRLKNLFAMGTFSELTRLNLASSFVNDKLLALIAGKCPNLKHFTVGQGWDLTTEGLARFLINCPQLKTVHLVHCKKRVNLRVLLSRFPSFSLSLRWLKITVEWSRDVPDTMSEAVKNLAPKLRVTFCYSKKLSPQEMNFDGHSDECMIDVPVSC